MWEDYYIPNNLNEALKILANYNGEARVIAGGTDLLLDLKKGSKQAQYLVDIRNIEGMKVIEERGDRIYLGAGVTHTQAANSRLIREKATALAEAAAQVGSLQVRNVGTIVGNVVNAQPAADTAVALVALGAEVEIAFPDGNRQLTKVVDLYAGTGKSRIDSTSSVVTGIYIPLIPNSKSTFLRIARRKSLALPVINVSIVLTMIDGVVTSTAITAGPVGPQPLHLREAENFLMGKVLTPEVISRTAKMAASEAQPRTSLLRGSRDYRQELLQVLIIRGLQALVN